MNKLNSLRTHLLANLPELKNNHERLLIFVDQGRIRSTAASGLSFEYSYTVNIILTDYTGSPDAVAVPLLAWVMVNQSELMTNLEKGKEAIQFEVDVIDENQVDMSLTLPLTERVIVKRLDDGTLQITHPEEPQYTEHLPATPMQLIANGDVLSSWTSAEPTGVDIETPQPGPSRG
ncbi:phage tail protein [Pseudomonas sp. M30-35]|uniref:phage tail protein n=1 Tax=Pseudomonas sp. M30-35 TaxID=1981174 RepID=UPI000B3CAC14|nr:phage tail protein [Pseudomonas sp. M30-35]ARU88291.1 phage tail protein [Pseudomonas sp. M30-35]